MHTARMEYMIGINASLFPCWRFFSMTRHSCQGFNRTLCFWQGKQLQSKVCWLLSKYSSLLYKGNWQTAETLTKQKTKKAPLVSGKGMSSHQLLQLEDLEDSYLKKHFETHIFFKSLRDTMVSIIDLWTNIILLFVPSKDTQF